MPQRLKRGLFWYYLEHIDKPARVLPDARNPCSPINFKKNNGYMLRVRYYEKRIAVEFFHVLSDGTGGTVFLLTLTAEYLKLKYGCDIPKGGFILDCGDPHTEEEISDSFLKCARDAAYTPKEPTSFMLKGSPVKDFPKVTTGSIDSKQIYAKAKSLGVTITEYLLAHMALSLSEIQYKQVSKRKVRPVMICVPVNLRKYYPSSTLRNFATIVNVGIHPELGGYTFDEAVKEIHHHMGLATGEKHINARVSSYVSSEKNLFMRACPLFLKDLALKIAFNHSGIRTSTTTLSNMGVVKLPEEMRKHVTRMDLMIGPLSKNPIVCACVTYEDTLNFTVVRTIEESDFERRFFTSLVKDGIHVKIESNSL